MRAATDERRSQPMGAIGRRCRRGFCCPATVLCSLPGSPDDAGVDDYPAASPASWQDRPVSCAISRNPGHRARDRTKASRPGFAQLMRTLAGGTAAAQTRAAVFEWARRQALSAASATSFADRRELPVRAGRRPSSVLKAHRRDRLAPGFPRPRPRFPCAARRRTRARRKPPPWAGGQGMRGRSATGRVSPSTSREKRHAHRGRTAASEPASAIARRQPVRGRRLSASVRARGA